MIHDKTIFLILDLKDKVVLITGASSGIGAATALEFNKEGAKLAIAARRKDKLEAIAAKLNDPLILNVDITIEEQLRLMITETIRHYGRIDILINNAASIIVSPAKPVSADDLLKAYKTNLLAPVLATQLVIESMKKNGGGQIINIGSPGFMMGVPFYAPYAITKAALSGWTRTIQAELSESGIFVSEFFPGYVKIESRPESRIGEVEQDFLMAEKQNFLVKYFTKPDTPEKIARQLVQLAKKPKILVCSGFSTRLGTYLSNIPGFRLSVAKKLAENARRKKKDSFPI